MTNKAELQNTISKINQKLYDENIDDAIFEELQLELSAAQKELRKLVINRKDGLTSLIAAINSNSYTLAEILEANPKVHLNFEVATTKIAKALVGNRKKPEAKVFPSDGNPVFILIPRKTDDHLNVIDVQIHQGRANEYYSGKAMFAAIGQPLLRMKADSVDAVLKNLEECIVDASKEFVKTSDGKNELKKIAEFVFNHVPRKKNSNISS